MHRTHLCCCNWALRLLVVVLCFGPQFLRTVQAWVLSPQIVPRRVAPTILHATKKPSKGETVHEKNVPITVSSTSSRLLLDNVTTEAMLPIMKPIAVNVSVAEIEEADGLLVEVGEKQDDDAVSVSVAEGEEETDVLLAEIDEKHQVDDVQLTTSLNAIAVSRIHPRNIKEEEDDLRFMKMAIELAQLDGGERGPRSAYPNPTVGALLVSANGTIVGRGRSDYRTEAVRACLQDAGLSVTPLQEWVVDTGGPNAPALAGSCTLYTTLEPSTRRRGTAMPPITHLIRAAAPLIRRIVIGCPSPVPQKAHLGAQFLHQAGLDVRLMEADSDVRVECQALIADFTASANGKLQRMARKHFQLFGRPLGFLHCSVIHSENIEAFRRHGNAFGTDFGPSTLSYRNFGAYELAPPPDVIWAEEDEALAADMPPLDDDDDDDEFVTVDFEDYPETTTPKVSPMMPWYHQVDAVVATFPRSGNGPPDDDSVTARLAGLVWLATYGQQLPAGVERILVLDATELPDLPLTNDDPQLPAGGVDIAAFWAGRDRKATRVLLRRGVHEAARAAATAAARAAQAAADAARAATAALESGVAMDAAAAARECARVATAAQVYLQEELERTQVLRERLESLGVIVESLEGGEPVDVMQHLGERNGLYSVVWRAGCWGDRGVRAILAGAFQWVSAHLAVPADGGRFWQLMMAENAVQAACGPQSKVKVFADQEDICMEYCDNVGDEDCVLSVEGKPIRHVRLDCRVALVDAERPREFDIAKTQKINRKVLVEQAPWFL